MPELRGWESRRWLWMAQSKVEVALDPSEGYGQPIGVEAALDPSAGYSQSIGVEAALDPSAGYSQSIGVEFELRVA